MNRRLLSALFACLLVGGAARETQAAAAGATRPAVRKAPAAKVSASQLFLRLDAIDKKMDELMKGVGAAATARPAVQMPGPGDGQAAKDMAGAFYNYGVYMKQASNARMAARLIRDVTVLGGTILAVSGWESARDKTVPRTMNNAYKHYPAFSFGVTTAFLGIVVGEVVELVASGSEAKAAKALMQPLEASPSGPAATP